MKNLETYRAEIDAIDEEIVKLLRKRYDVIEQVGNLKAENGMPATIPERVDEVRENAGRLAAQIGLDSEFVRDLYARLIKHSCELEEEIIEGLRRNPQQNRAS